MQTAKQRHLFAAKALEVKAFAGQIGNTTRSQLPELQ
jgi:hypothetical protein